jgi:hypothetical protein
VRPRWIPALVLVGVLIALVSAARSQTVETQKSMPPAPGVKSPEYAPPLKPPNDQPTLGPRAGEPTLKPAPNTVDERGRPVQPARNTILGLSPMAAVWVGLGIVGVLVLILSAMAGPGRGGRKDLPPPR